MLNLYIWYLSIYLCTIYSKLYSHTMHHYVTQPIYCGAEWSEETDEACHSRAQSTCGSGGPRPGYEPSCPLRNYVTLGNFLSSLKTRFSLLTRRDKGCSPACLGGWLHSNPVTDVDVLCKLWSPIQMWAILPGPPAALTRQTGCSARSRPLMDAQTSLSTVPSPLMWRKQHGGRLFWTQSWPMRDDGVGFPVHKAFHMHHFTWFSQQPKESMEAGS